MVEIISRKEKSFEKYMKSKKLAIFEGRKIRRHFKKGGIRGGYKM